MEQNEVIQKLESKSSTTANQLKQKNKQKSIIPVHEITAGHRSLSGTISCVTDRIRFLPVTMTGRFSNLNSISYVEDWHDLRVTGTKCLLPDSMSSTGEIFISGAELAVLLNLLTISLRMNILLYNCRFHRHNS